MLAYLDVLLPVLLVLGAVLLYLYRVYGPFLKECLTLMYYGKDVE